jgi:hypothetical protein
MGSHEWGCETGTMFKLVWGFQCGKATMLINAGQIAGSEALQRVRDGWPLLAVEGSGRFADELSATVRRDQFTKSAKVSEIVRSGRVVLFHVEDPAEKLKNELRRMLGG